MRKKQKGNGRKYQRAKNEKEAAVKIHACGGDMGSIELLLRRAAFHDDLYTARAALETGVDPNSQNILGESAWKTACKKSSTEMIRLFLEHGARLGPDKFGTPPLIHAIENSREDVAMELIKAGADVNGRENLVLKTPLHKAATGHKTFNILVALLEAGADPREVDRAGDDALANAKFFNSEFGGVDPKVFKVLQSALKKWKGKPLPKKPRRKPKSELQKQATEIYLAKQRLG